MFCDIPEQFLICFDGYSRILCLQVFKPFPRFFRGKRQRQGKGRKAGKDADFLVFDNDLLKAEQEGFSYNSPKDVYFRGKKVK